jgi:hypothetical protein
MPMMLKIKKGDNYKKTNLHLSYYAVFSFIFPNPVLRKIMGKNYRLGAFYRRLGNIDP